MRHIYTFFLYCLSPWIVLRLYWKGRSLPAYRQRILERFSRGNTTATHTDIWIHAVSLGEVVAATPLIELCLAKHWHVLVTTMTPTGSQHVIKQFGERVHHQYLPYDLPGPLRRFFSRYQPRLGLIMETELWPNLIHYAKSKQVPLLLMNARISQEAFRSYARIRYLLKPMLLQFTAILTQSAEDTERFLALGGSSALVRTFGNMKFDVKIPTTNSLRAQQLKASWGLTRPVLIAASTHDKEEELLLSGLATLQKTMPGVLLLLAPRHPERFHSVYRLCQQEGFKTALCSEDLTLDTTTQVAILDCLGELLHFYAISDYAFVGGSFVPVGGHNVLEPIALKIPVFCGPYLHNTKGITNPLRKIQAIQVIQNPDELTVALVHLHQHSELKQQMIQRATSILESNQGIIQRYFQEVEYYLTKVPVVNIPPEHTLN